MKAINLNSRDSKFSQVGGVFVNRKIMLQKTVFTFLSKTVLLDFRLLMENKKLRKFW